MTNKEILNYHIELLHIDEPVDTYAGWKRAGYQVKKGAKALFKARIWKPIKDKETEEKKLILVTAAYFGKSQVEEAGA